MSIPLAGDSTVFLLGAGFSKSIDLDMPLMGELPKRLEFGSNSAAQRFCDQTFIDDFEAWLSSLASVCPWVEKHEEASRKEAFFEVLKAIQVGLIPPNNRIVEQFTFLAMDNEPYHWIFKLLKYWHDHQCGVITLNYDTIVESIAKYFLFGRDGSQVSEFDFYPHGKLPSASFQLFKLHGSINLWSNDPLVGKNLRQVETCDQENRSKLIKKGYMPYIVPPLSVKDSYYENSTLKVSWEQALIKVQEARRLVVMGYSFPASDWIMKAFLRNLNKDAIIDIVDVGSNAVLRAESIFSQEGRQVNAFINSTNPIEKYLEN